MIDHRRARACLAAVLVVATAGAIDAALGRVWDHVALFLVAIGLVVAALWPGRGGRGTISVRGDLFRWIQRRADMDGESVDDVTDRAVATYRSQWLPPEESLP